jgi:type I restriction enzyme R subunit
VQDCEYFKVKIRDGKEREIQHMMCHIVLECRRHTRFRQKSLLHNLFGSLPRFFQKRRMNYAHFGATLSQEANITGETSRSRVRQRRTQHDCNKLINAEKSDLFDVLEYVFNSDTQTNDKRSKSCCGTSDHFFALLDNKQKEFIEFVLSKYIETGVEELDQEKLPILLTNKYQSLEDAKEMLGEAGNISKLFVAFQRYLYEERVA